MRDEVAEWLRRWTANPMCSARVGSNPILVVCFFFFPLLFILVISRVQIIITIIFYQKISQPFEA